MDRLVFSSLASISDPSARTQLNNEIANMSTTGFKKSFMNASSAMKISGPGFDTRYQPTNSNQDRISLVSGAVLHTGNKLDVAMSNQTVMAVSGSNEELAYTRRGDLRVNSKGLLETGAGQAVRGQNGAISVPPGFDMTITEDGSVYATNPSGPATAPPTLVGRIMLRDASETKLQRRLDGLFEPVGAKGTEGREITNGKETAALIPQSLEGSNVSPYESMVRLMEMNRSYEQSIKMIEEAKSVDESGTQMLKVV